MPAKEEFFEFYKLTCIGRRVCIGQESREMKEVIDENTCRTFGWERALGKSFSIMKITGQRSLYKVVGVVRNFSYRSPTSEPGLIAFTAS